MIPPIKVYTSIPAAKISEKISAARPEFPTVISDLISHYAQTDYSTALKPLRKNIIDAELNQAIKDAFTSPECDPQLKVDIIYLAVEHDCCSRLARLIAELLDSGQDVYLNNTEYYAHGFCMDWLFVREDLIGTTQAPRNFGTVHFTGARLACVHLNLAYLPGANFKGAKFVQTSLAGAFLYGADFSDTDVSSTWFNASPRYSRLPSGRHILQPVQTNLSFAKFNNSDIARAKFAGSILDVTSFIGTKNMDTADFEGAQSAFCQLVDPASDDEQGCSMHSKWTQIYFRAYSELPSAEQLKGFNLKLANYGPDQLLPHAAHIGKLGERLSDFVAFSKLPGGHMCDKNLFLIAHGIFPSELAAYNQLRAAGKEREKAIAKVKEDRRVA